MKELTPFPLTGLVLLGYSRISNQDKERELSIEIQNERLASEGVHRLYWDQQSGDDDDRPEYVKLLADCEELAIAGRKVEIVACRLDRLSRGDRELERVIEWIEELGCRFRALDGGYYGSTDLHDWLRLRQEATMAQYWIRQTSFTRRKRMANKREKGQPTLGTPPIGYRYNADHTALEIDPETGPVVRKAFEMYLNGSSMRKLAQFMNSNISSVRYMLKNPTYRGHLWYTKGGRTSKKVRGRERMPKELAYNRHPAIISEEEWRQIEQRINENKRLWGNNAKRRRYPLQGLVFCADCGHRLNITHKENTRRRYILMYCRNMQCPNNKWVQSVEYEAAIQEAIEERAAALAELPVEDEDTINPRVAELEAKIAQLEPLSDEPLIAEQIERFRFEIRQMQNSPSPNDEGLKAIATGLIGAPWAKLPDDERKRLYSTLVKGVWTRGKTVLEIRLTF